MNYEDDEPEIFSCEVRLKNNECTQSTCGKSSHYSQNCSEDISRNLLIVVGSMPDPIEVSTLRQAAYTNCVSLHPGV